jgi:hypothetical protein
VKIGQLVQNELGDKYTGIMVNARAYYLLLVIKSVLRRRCEVLSWHNVRMAFRENIST